MSTPSESPSPAAAAPAATTSHPPGLYVLFFTEMWERFSYYGMRALLVLYMVNYLKWSQTRASGVYKWYTSLVYLTPIFGGYIADYWNRQGKSGNKRAVVIGAVMMSIGQFMMTVESIPVFYAALLFLILGNGMFKPNMSTQVGRLYPEKEFGKRDAAYTIFYMGINLGAFFSPLICGWLRENMNQGMGYHWGFAAAGVGMLIGALTYVLGIRGVREISGDTSSGTHASGIEADDAPTKLPVFSKVAPKLVLSIGIVMVLGAVIGFVTGKMAGDNALGLFIGSGAALVAGWILSQVQGAARDRVLAIYSVFVFVVGFWAAFEQAGNAMNLWADQFTNRVLVAVPAAQAAAETTGEPDSGAAQLIWGLVRFLAMCIPAAAWYAFRRLRRRGPVLGYTVFDVIYLVPGITLLGLVAAGLVAIFLGMAPAAAYRAFSPVPTEWFQSINALAVFALAPLFAAMWMWLDRRGLNPSIATKMGIGVVLQGVAFALMILSAKAEDQPSAAALASLPPVLTPAADGHLEYRDAPDYNPALDTSRTTDPVPAQSRRMRFEGGELRMSGVLADVERDRILRASAPEGFIKAAMELTRKTNESPAGAPVTITLEETPPGFDLKWSGIDPAKLAFDPATRQLTATGFRMHDKDYKTLLLAASDPGLRAALGRLYAISAPLKVSSWWLLWFYVISTLGELCLSPLGLSMVSKLAPTRFATMLMGMWLLTSFFGNFVAGALGETWGTVTPSSYFLLLTAVLGGMALLLFLLVRKIVVMMHGVR